MLRSAPTPSSAVSGQMSSAMDEAETQDALALWTHDETCNHDCVSEGSPYLDETGRGRPYPTPTLAADLTAKPVARPLMPTSCIQSIQSSCEAKRAAPTPLDGTARKSLRATQATPTRAPSIAPTIQVTSGRARRSLAAELDLLSDGYGQRQESNMVLGHEQYVGSEEQQQSETHLQRCSMQVPPKDSDKELALMKEKLQAQEVELAKLRSLSGQSVQALSLRNTFRNIYIR